MNSRQRILTALSCRQPDRVPFMFASIDPGLQEEILGRTLTEYTFDLHFNPGVVGEPGENMKWALNYLVHPATARFLQLDAVGVHFSVPLFCKTRFGRGGHSIAKGLLDSWDAVKKARWPDVNDEKIYREAEKFVRTFRDEFAVFANIRLGVSPTLMSMGYDNFSYLLCDDRELVHKVVDLYTEWVSGLVRNLNEIGFDFLWAFDDIAFKTGPLFSVAVWNDVFVPRLRKVTESIRCPWIYHSDGNLLPILDGMLPLGMSGIHPLEPGAMDLDVLKAKYGRRLCLIGNIDVDYTLSQVRPEEVESVVRARIRQLAWGGGYIIADSNSVPYYCKAENVIAMSKAVQKYRGYYDGGTSA